jgi:carbonic anhydrase/acetyltransferase-like protein (isoleucine patch superfamily)
MNIIKFQDKLPTIDPSAYISLGVYIIGNVTIGKDSNVWFGSVLRGDVAPIDIGQSTNIQDGTIIHTSRNDGPTYIGDNVTIGHRAVIHACTIQDYGFVGMSATVMDKAIVEPFGFVAAGALVAPGKVVGARQLWSGVPARYIRDLTEAEVDHVRSSAEHYVRLAKIYKNA